MTIVWVVMVHWTASCDGYEPSAVFAAEEDAYTYVKELEEDSKSGWPRVFVEAVRYYD